MKLADAARRKKECDGRLLVQDRAALAASGTPCGDGDEEAIHVRPNVKLTGVRQRAAAGPE
jgi:hypothetical protein